MIAVYHVVYFCDQKYTGWISELHCVPFEGLSSFPPLETQVNALGARRGNRQFSLVSKRHQKTWEKAVTEADSSLKVRRNSRLRRLCLCARNTEARASSLHQLQQDNVPNVSGPPACRQAESKVSLGGRKRCRAPVDDDTACSISSPKKTRYEQDQEDNNSGCIWESSVACRVENECDVERDTTVLKKRVSDCLSGDDGGETVRSSVSEAQPASQPLAPLHGVHTTATDWKLLRRRHTVSSCAVTADRRERLVNCITESAAAGLCAERRRLRSDFVTTSSLTVCKPSGLKESADNNTIRCQEPNSLVSTSDSAALCSERRQLRSSSVAASPLSSLKTDDERLAISVESKRRRSLPVNAAVNTRKRNSTKFSPAFSVRGSVQRQAKISGMVRFDKHLQEYMNLSLIHISEPTRPY